MPIIPELLDASESAIRNQMRAQVSDFCWLACLSFAGSQMPKGVHNESLTHTFGYVTHVWPVDTKCSLTALIKNEVRLEQKLGHIGGGAGG